MALEFDFPRRPYAEFYLDDSSTSDWRNVIEDVRQNPGIKIERAIKSETSDPTPSECTFQLDNGPDHGNGDYSPSNPMGLYYPNFIQNIPFRFGFELTDDDFDRTVASGWGSSTRHSLAWSEVEIGTTASSVSSGEGRHSITSTSSYVQSYLADVNVKNVDVSVSFDIYDTPFADVTGGNIEPANILLRGQSSAEYILCRMTVDQDEDVILQIRRHNAQGEVSLATAEFTGSDRWNGFLWRVRAQADGDTIRMKAWDVAQGEPVDWMLEYTMVDYRYGPGFVGIRSGVSSGNSNTKPIVFRYSDFAVRLPRYSGETSVVQPKSDMSGANKITYIECGTLFRRKEQGKSPVKSALASFVPENVPGLMGYWPAEDNKFSDQIASGLAGGIPMRVEGPASSIVGGVSGNTGNTVEFEADDSIACTSPLPHTNLSTWSAYFDSYTDTGRFDIRFLLKVPSPQDPSLFAIAPKFNGTVFLWNIQLEDDGSLTVRAQNESGLIVDDTGNPVIYNTPALWYFQLVQDGADVDYTLTYLGLGAATFTAYTSGTVAAHTLGRAHSLRVFSGFEGLDITPSDLTLGHLMMGTTSFGSTGFIDPLNAYVGETATARIVRLLAQEGAPTLGQSSDVTTSAEMGPQLVDTLVNNLKECARTDGGILFDSRGANSFAYVALADLYAKESTVTIDYDQNHLAPDFEPSYDDAPIVNDVTVKSHRGSQYQVIAEEGPRNANDSGTVAGAVGRYDKQLDVNPVASTELANIAAWALHKGTTDEPRFPNVSINLASPDVENDTAFALSIMDLDVASVMTLINLQNWDIYDSNEQIVLGYTEILEDENGVHAISFNTTPASPYRVGALGDRGMVLDSYGVGGSTLAAGIDADDVTLSVATPDTRTRWVVAADEIISGAVTGQGTSITPDYIIATDSDAADIAIGDEGYLYTSAGVKKEATQFTVTGLNSASGFTNVEYSPNSAAVTNSGDIFVAHYASNFGFDIMVGGERMTVTAITGTSSPQSFTVVRQVNQVTKSHAIDAPVTVANPYFIGK